MYCFLNFTMPHYVLNQSWVPQSSCGNIWRCLLEASCSVGLEFIPNVLPSLHMKTTNLSFKCRKHEGTLTPLFWSHDHIQSSWKSSKKPALTSFCLLNRTETNSSFEWVQLGKTGFIMLLSAETVADLMRSTPSPFSWIAPWHIHKMIISDSVCPFLSSFVSLVFFLSNFSFE